MPSSEKGFPLAILAWFHVSGLELAIPRVPWVHASIGTATAAPSPIFSKSKLTDAVSYN